MDEYGGTEGVITMEDILEEIVGDFHNNNPSEDKTYTTTARWIILYPGFNVYRRF